MVYKFIKIIDSVIVASSGVFTDGYTPLDDELLEIANLGDNINDIYKKSTKSKLWSMLPKKEKQAKKIIIRKPEMTDEELEKQLEIYWNKYEDAKAGLDVFEGQALALGITQEEYRQLIIQKGDEFILAKKKMHDMIEMTRQLAEDKINLITNEDDYKNVLELLKNTDEFTLETTLQEIKDTWS